MFSMFLAAAAALPAPLAASDREDLHCVAVLAVVAHDQGSGLWGDVAPLRDDGARYAARVGDGLVERGIAQDAVRNLLLSEAKGLQRAGPLKRPAIDKCVARMRVVVPPMSMARCSALMTYAATLARREEPDSANTREIVALAPVVAYRAQQAGVTTEQLATENERVAREVRIDGDELNDCARLAVEPKK